MFSDLSNFLSFVHINTYNQYFLIIIFSILSIFSIIINKYNIIFKNSITNFYKNTVLTVYTLSFLIFLYYIYIFLYFKNLILIENTIFFNFSYNYIVHKFYDTSSIIIIYLCYLIGFISLLTLGDRFWSLNYLLSPIFLYFLIIINFLCQSSSLFELFIYYELLLLPSIFFVYKGGYTKKSYQANVYFFLWTQLGSLLVLFGIIYLSFIVGSTSYSTIKNFQFSGFDKYLLYTIFFLGFGVKVPLWPFHFWLIKVHVEAPSGFSIFLSGFLVKTAVFCFYKIVILLNVKQVYLFPIIVCILGMLDSSIKMWFQTDIKKLIAYATVQEMNSIFLLFNFGDSWAINAGLIFLLAHGLLSALMFFLIECIYKRYNTRSLFKIYGLTQLYPNLGLSIWAMLILFFGFPGTIKFYAELHLCFLLANNDLISTLFILFIFIFINSLGFAKCWFSVLYGHPGYPSPKPDLTKEESLIIFYLVFLSLISCFFIFLL